MTMIWRIAKTVHILNIPFIDVVVLWPLLVFGEGVDNSASSIAHATSSFLNLHTVYFQLLHPSGPFWNRSSKFATKPK